MGLLFSMNWGVELEGAFDGLDDGRDVGAPEGCLEGSGVGAVDGLEDGESVGATVHNTPSPPKPGLQLHEKPPSASVHVASAWQL